MVLFNHKGLSIVIILGDIVDQDTDALVCPSNSYGHMRGGVAQTIRMRGGDVIEEHALSHAPIRIGKAIATTGGSLKASRIFHAPTMQEPIEVAHPKNVSAAMRAALELAWKERIQSISFPGMGTGTGCLGYQEAAEIMIEEICYAVGKSHTLRRIHIVANSQELFDALITVAEQRINGPSRPRG